MKKVELWFNRIMVVAMGLCTFLGLVAGTQQNKAYEERSYILLLAVFALLLFFWFANQLEKVGNKIKNEQKIDGTEYLTH